MKEKVFEFLDKLEGSNIYITDPETDKIVFINKRMRDRYHLQNAEGKICWKILQPGMTKRCDFCKLPELKKNKDQKILWRENNLLVNETFDNCDYMLEIDGKNYHVQESIEMNEQIALHKKATYDEISGVYNHATGKDILYQLLSNDHPDFTIVLVNIDNMRKINEQCGRNEGDFLLKRFASCICSYLNNKEFIYHYSGDEFVVVFFREQNEIITLLTNIEEEMKQYCKSEHKPYLFSYTSGMVHVSHQVHSDLNKLMTIADERMYEKKLRLHRSNILEETDHVENTQHNFSDYFDVHFNQLFDALSKSTDDFIFLSDLNSGVFRYSPKLVKFLNMPSELMVNPLSFWKTIVHPDDWDKFYLSNMQISDRKIDYHSIAYRVKNAKGEYVWLKCRGRVISNPELNSLIFAGIITLMGRQNHIDPLTQIPNQIQFIDVLHQKLEDPSFDSLSLMLVDIDDFKSLNEIYKREFGDFILKEVAQLFQSVLPDTAGLFRLEKDLFAIIYENSNIKDLQNLYDELSKSLLKAYMEKQFSVSLSISGGCATYPSDCNNLDLLVEYCEVALQNAKENGKAQLSFFYPSILTSKQDKLQLMKQLNDSIVNNFDRFELYYQPQVDANSHCIKGVEVLLRWKDENGNMVSPMTFIPVLEEYDYIKVVTLWIFKKALLDAKEWLEIDSSFTVSINISVLHLLEDNFYESILNILDETHFPIQNIILEITESTTARNIYVLQNRLSTLQELGFHIALDDFGTGYSSLNILKSSPFNIVKIDKSFMKNLEINEYNYTFIQFVSNIVHHAKMKVCLEGVETKEQLDLVLPLNLDYIQGYLFGKPVPSHEIKPLIIKNKLFDDEKTQE